MKKILFVILSLALSVRANAQVCFLSASQYTITGSASSAASGDFNGDNKKDIVVVGGKDSANSVSSSDFNGDGKLDLAITSSGKNKFLLRFGIGNGTFGAVTSFAVGSGPWGIISEDFNKDGKMDVALTNKDIDSVSVLIGNGNGGFGVATKYLVGSKPTALSIGDFNNDNNMDMVIANSNGSNISLLFGNSFGVFSSATNIAVNGNPNDILVSDFNGDGKVDIVTACSSSHRIDVLIGNGAGSFIPSSINFSSSIYPNALSSNDFNNDGKKDIAIADGGGYVKVLVGDGLGMFSTPLDFTVGTGAGFLISDDFNMDNKVDIVTSNVSVFINCTPLGVQEQSLKNEISIFPNPNNGIFSISTKNLNIESILEIYNMIGKKVHKSFLLGGQIEEKINISDYPKGIYCLMIKDKSHTYTSKITIE